jgi:hypothetical protein
VQTICKEKKKRPFSEPLPLPLGQVCQLIIDLWNLLSTFFAYFVEANHYFGF